jgi:Yip1-like protein
LTGFTGRMIGAARLEVAIYEEVEADTGATLQAMAVVILASIAAGIGSVGVGSGGVRNIVMSGVGSLAGWVIWAFMTYVIGTKLLPEPQTEADTGQLMRTLGFAQAPGITRILVGVPAIGPLVLLLASLWMLVAMIIAVRQALDYRSTWRALAVCVIGWLIAIAIPALLMVTTGVER